MTRDRMKLQLLNSDYAFHQIFFLTGKRQKRFLITMTAAGVLTFCASNNSYQSYIATHLTHLPIARMSQDNSPVQKILLSFWPNCQTSAAAGGKKE